MMKLSRATQHFGEQKKLQLPGTSVAIVHTELSAKHVGWHYHENAHLTFILRGEVIEGTRKEVLKCSAGDLLFHGPLEPHYNIESQGNTRCLHIDFTQNYLDGVLNKRKLEGIFNVRNSAIKFLCYKVFKEAISDDDMSTVAINALSLEILGQLLFADDMARRPRPRWVNKLEQILQTAYAEKFSLDALSGELSIHPVHLSRSFRQYFHCTLGEYVRKVRVERSLAFMPDQNLSLTEIACACGFADQSHFLRSFKQIMGVTPSAYRRVFSR